MTMEPYSDLVIHGLQDDVVPIQVSQEYGKKRAYVRLLEVESDHSLGVQLATIWAETTRFCSL